MLCSIIDSENNALALLIEWVWESFSFHLAAKLLLFGLMQNDSHHDKQNVAKHKKQ
jgi:hypothetical protein